jgi:hypothetical protein
VGDKHIKNIGNIMKNRTHQGKVTDERRRVKEESCREDPRW